MGHAFSEPDLVTAKSQGLENALWAALRALEESASIEHRAAKKAGSMGSARLQESAHAKQHQANIIREMLLHHPPLKRSKAPRAKRSVKR